MNNLEKPLFLQRAIEICEKIETGKFMVDISPYIDAETQYILSITEEPVGVKWIDCKVNNQPDWFAYRPVEAPLTSLYLKNRTSQKVYYLSL